MRDSAVCFQESLKWVTAIFGCYNLGAAMWGLQFERQPSENNFMNTLAPA